MTDKEGSSMSLPNDFAMDVPCDLGKLLPPFGVGFSYP